MPDHVPAGAPRKRGGFSPSPPALYFRRTVFCPADSAASMRSGSTVFTDGDHRHIVGIPPDTFGDGANLTLNKIDVCVQPHSRLKLYSQQGAHRKTRL